MKKPMRQVMKTIFLVMAALLVLLPRGHAYTPDGPVGNGGDAWQVPEDGFGPPRDAVAPKNLGEEYRRNVPVLYYACDANFLDYFGTSGQMAVDSAFGVLNNVFTNNPTGRKVGLDGYSFLLSEFPLEIQHINYQAQVLGLYDVKSTIMAEMMEQLGLADPTYYVYGIHDWIHVGPVGCPVGQEYDVVMRNFDYFSTPLNQLQYSAYINDVLYSYDIIEDCTGPNPVRVAEPFAVDFLANGYTPLADQTHNATWGVYYTGLTRDDVAGLRRLLTASDIKTETISPDSLLLTITTNTLAPEVFPPTLSGTNFLNATNGNYYVYNGQYGYGNLAAFLSFVSTNGPAAVQAVYPGVIISSYTVTDTIVSIPNIIGYYTNAPVGSPYGSPPTFVIATNYTKAFEFLYKYQFANVFTNHYGPTKELLITMTVGSPPGSPYGSPGVTNTTVRKLQGYSGDFFVLPPFGTNVCPLDILPGPAIPTVLALTNGLGLALTNSTVTNLLSVTYMVTYFTNYSYVIDPVTCSTVAGETGLYEGIEKIQFIGTNFDSLLSQYFYPITNYYTMKFITNSQVQVQNLERIVTQPDFLFSAQDLTPGPNVGPPLNVIDQVTVPPFDTANVLPGLAGPGTILSPSTISLNKVGPVFFNSFGDVLDGTPLFTEQPGSDVADEFYDLYFIWASFDGTTNDPVVYPDGTSIDNLDYQILVNVSPKTVPGGQNGTSYPGVTFGATSTFFVTPFSWSASDLPPGLSLTSNPDNTATLSGTPTLSGTYTFTLTLTDGLGRSVSWYYLMTIQ